MLYFSIACTGWTELSPDKRDINVLNVSAKCKVLRIIFVGRCFDQLIEPDTREQDF